MRKLVGAAFVSLDGVIQAPGGPREDWTGGFRFGGWTFPHSDDTTGAAVMSLFDGPFDLLLGRRTYEIFSAYWPYIPEGHPIADPFNAAAKYVLTRSDEELPWNNSHRVADIDAVAGIKASEGPDLVIQGSSTLYPQLLAAGLIDRFTLLTFPVVLGGGKKLFGEGTPPLGLKMVDHKTSATGVQIVTYVPDGEVKTGSFLEIEPSERELARQERMKVEG